MNKAKDLQELSVGELLKQKKTTELITGLLAGMLMTLFALNIYTVVTGKQSAASFAIPLALSPIIFANWGRIKKIKEELRIRQQFK
jgi:hypothetical protein